MPTGREMEKALYQGKALREQQEADLGQRALRAARDVLDKSVESCEAAARGRGVTVERVRKAVKALREESLTAELGPMCACGHPKRNHRDNGGACRIFVMRKATACGCEAFHDA